MLLLVGANGCSQTDPNAPGAEFTGNADFNINATDVRFDDQLQQLIFTITVDGNAGGTVPMPVGSLDGAPVLGYVVPTTLRAEDVGFAPTEGIVAMALTSHPDFDDTPLWDENTDKDYANDGVVWHPHWVILVEDERVPGGLSVKQFAGSSEGLLPPTNPGMPMYMDSPGFPVLTDGNEIKVIVPAYRMNNQTQFNYDGVAAYMQVIGSDTERPMLGVYTVYSIASGDLSLPYTVR
ncbi:hypothetical protein A3850_005810 [Lewinella sp. 4G2]|nr:hypothetical protein A3850_005810 [Lewinella sp. 4G2]